MIVHAQHPEAQFRALLVDQRARRDAEAAIHPVYGQLGRAITQANLDRVRTTGPGAGAYYPDAGRSVSGEYVDPDTGGRLAYQGLQGPMPSVNDATTAQQLNAPDASGAQRFVNETAPGYIEGGVHLVDSAKQTSVEALNSSQIASMKWELTVLPIFGASVGLSGYSVRC